MFYIPVVESTKILCDDSSLVNNSSILSSILNKNHISIAYHFDRWHVEAGVIKVACIGTNDNLVDAMTNRLAS